MVNQSANLELKKSWPNSFQSDVGDLYMMTLNKIKQKF